MNRPYILGFVYEAMRAGNSDLYGYKHILRVARQAEPNHELTAIALTHDIVEDGFASFEQLHDWGLSVIEIEAVRILTRLSPEEQSYDEYIDSIIAARHTEAGKLAIQVKQFDLYDHLHPDRVRQRSANGTKKYLKALAKLVWVQRG